jgi:hypothetical protein
VQKEKRGIPSFAFHLPFIWQHGRVVVVVVVVVVVGRRHAVSLQLKFTVLAAPAAVTSPSTRLLSSALLSFAPLSKFLLRSANVDFVRDNGVYIGLPQPPPPAPLSESLDYPSDSLPLPKVAAAAKSGCSSS